MNQLIDNLAVEAGFVWREGGSLTQGHTIEDVERFAELLIGECAMIDFCKQVGVGTLEAAEVSRVIKQHFGVKE